MLSSMDDHSRRPDMPLRPSPFKNPDAVRGQMQFPCVLRYSFIGESSTRYHAQLEEIVVRVAGEPNVRRREFRESAQGAYTAYKFEVFHESFEDVEEIYRAVGALDGTRFMV